MNNQHCELARASSRSCLRDGGAGASLFPPSEKADVAGVAEAEAPPVSAGFWPNAPPPKRLGVGADAPAAGAAAALSTGLAGSPNNPPPVTGVEGPMVQTRGQKRVHSRKTRKGHTRPRSWWLAEN